MAFAAPVLSTLARFVAGSRTVRRALVVTAAAAPLLLLAAPASALPVGPAAAPAAGTAPESRTAAAPAPATSAPHCALIAGAATLRCFATYRGAVAYGTGGRVTDAPVSATDAATDTAFAAEVNAPVAPLASVLVGTEYADANFRGATLNLFAAGRCDNSSDVDFRFASLPAGWNDRITSFKSFSNCAQQLFRNTSFTGGALTLIISSLANVGAAANDQASSITFN
ncbi:MAG TPA: hypothetical protein VGP36_15415 [Mycobacteriales bacterium]|jgi:hypothetical protein|nr:hypothetical protein [Mycobacteriales bacterium]